MRRWVEENDMQCPKCKHDNREGAKFCEECSEKLQLRCSKCGSELRANAKFCDECGTKVSESDTAVITVPKLEDMHAQLQSMIPDELAQKYMTAEQQATGENRPITALFADISGFTPLSATKSSEAMFQLVQDCFKQLVGIVARYEGSISGFRGDGLLALFGAPILRENDAERSILAGIEMRDMMHSRGLEVSIGINTAMMTVGEIQTQLHSEYTAYGTDVILAARLQQNANPGQILVGAGTHRLTRRAFDFEIISDLSLKGFSQTVTAYSVLHVKAHPEKLRGIEGLRAKMIGREHEFTDIKESVDQWLSGHGQIVSVIGEAGIGKSRLVSELKTYLHTLNPGNSNSPFEKGGWGDLKNLTLEGRCVSIGQPISYWPFIDILRTYFNLKEDDDPSTIAQKVTDGTKHVFPNTSDETLPFIGRLLSVRFGNELDDRLKFATPEQIRHQTLMQLRDFFRELANKQPLLLILEDLHWSDELSIDLITYLMDELSHAPLMLLCVYRPEKEQKIWKLGEQAQRKCLDRYTEIMLKRLSRLEGRLLVEELLTIDDLPDSVKNTILEKSEGNPFFIEEVIRSLIEQDMVYRDSDRWRARTEIVNINVPDTIQSVLLSRVDRLQSEARYVLQCASVIGRLFKYSLLDHLTSQERNLNSYLTEFEDRELVYEERRIPELEYAFKHALTQEATYQSILERRRKEFHHQIAIGIERLYQERIEEYYEELAQHYSKTDDADKAIEYLIKAGKRSKLNYANESAISYYQKALEILEKIEHPSDSHLNWKLEILSELGGICGNVSKVAESEKFFKEAIELAKELNVPPRRLAKLYHDISMRTLFWQTKYDEALEYSKLGLEILGDDNKCAESALLNAIISLLYGYKGDGEKSSEYIKRDMEFIKDLPYDMEFTEIYAFISGDLLWHDKEPESALEWLEELEIISKKHHDLVGIAESWRMQAYILWDKGKLKEALLLNQKALELFERTGTVVVLTKCLWKTADMLITLGNIKEAEPIAIRSFEIAEQANSIPDMLLAYCYLAEIYLCKHEWEKALLYYQRCLELNQKLDQARKTDQYKGIFYSLGYAYMKSGDYENAIRILEEFIDYWVIYSPFDEYSRLSTIANALLWIEESYIALGRHQEYMPFQQSFIEKHHEAIDKLPQIQWRLEPANLNEKSNNLIYQDNFSAKALDPSWAWVSEFDDCAYEFTEDGLVINAANGRSLANKTAPRLVREIAGDFAVEVCMSPVSNEKPSICGILVWKNDNNVCLKMGDQSQREIRMEVTVDGKSRLSGHGLLPDSDKDKTYLRLERVGSLFYAYCSIDSENWYIYGTMDLPMEDPIQLSIYARGYIDRTIYCGEYKEGTATLFRNFRLWTK